MGKSDLPFGSEFSPSQIDLAEVLQLADEHGGDWRAFEAAIKARYFAAHKTSDYNRAKLANNCKLGMIAYGIIDRDAKLTEFGRQLHALASKPADLYAALGRHILLHLRGVTLVQGVLDMQVAGETVDLNKLRHWLEKLGVNFPRGGKHPSIMRLWLQKAGVFVDGWRVNEAKLKGLTGTDAAELDALSMLTPQQKAYLKALANLGPQGTHRSNEVEKLAHATYGIAFDEKNLPKQVLYPLAEAGYIELTRGTKAEGRGAKPFLVAPTPKLVADVIQPLLEQLEKQTASDLRPLLRKSLPDILRELDSKDKHIRGLALEALAFKLMQLLDLTYLATRLRGEATGGAEVDVLFESARLIYSRWQVQCKNTARVSLDDVAKEVGLTHFLKSTAIVIVTTGEIGPEARRYANKVAKESNLCFVMVNGDDLRAIEANPTRIVDVFNREASHAMKLKALEL